MMRCLMLFLALVTSSHAGAAITGCKPGQCADPLVCIIGAKSECGCPASYSGAPQVLVPAQYCSPVCAKIKGSALVCGENINGPSPINSAYCRQSSKTTGSCVCNQSGFQFELSQTVQTDSLSGTKYYTGTCICPASSYILSGPSGSSSTICKAACYKTGSPVALDVVCASDGYEQPAPCSSGHCACSAPFVEVLTAVTDAVSGKPFYSSKCGCPTGFVKIYTSPSGGGPPSLTCAATCGEHTGGPNDAGPPFTAPLICGTGTSCDSAAHQSCLCNGASVLFYSYSSSSSDSSAWTATC